MKALFLNVRNLFEEFDYTAFLLKKQTISLIPMINASRKYKQKSLQLTKTHLKPFKDLNGDKTLPLAFPCLFVGSQDVLVVALSMTEKKKKYCRRHLMFFFLCVTIWG